MTWTEHPIPTDWTSRGPDQRWSWLREILTTVGEHDQIACRGQSKNFQPQNTLHSSIDRVFAESGVSGPMATTLERLAIIRFLQQAPNYLPVAELQHLYEPVGLLMLMRHYGGPTRLLDWTSSIWIAAFNAASGSWREPGIIWVFHRDRFDRGVGERFKGQTKWALSSEPCPGFEGVKLPAVTVRALDRWVCRLIDIGPRIPRVIAQQGMFTIGSQLGIDHAEFIDGVMPDTPESWKHRIVIPCDLKPRLLKELERMGITASSLYPGIDGVGKYVSTFAHFGHEDEGVIAVAKGPCGTLKQAPPSA